jgi:hypothetical protein
LASDLICRIRFTFFGIRHDAQALRRRIPAPKADFVAGAQATDAKTGGCVQFAYFNTGRIDIVRQPPVSCLIALLSMIAETGD